MDNLGDRIKFARQNHPDGKMTQGALAKAAGISQTTIADIERGRNSGTTKIVDIARVLKVSVIWLNSGKGDMRTGAQSHIDTTHNEQDANTSEILKMLELLDDTKRSEIRQILEILTRGASKKYPGRR